MSKLDALVEKLQNVLGDKVGNIKVALGEVTLDVALTDYETVALQLRDGDDLKFEQLIDLCGVDYSQYAGEAKPAGRFAVVSSLLSVTHNWRLRLRVLADNDDFPVVPSVTGIWNSANWFEREAFDLFGIVFSGHTDLRRLLTDYGFVGHPFRKDFPISGNVEMRYDPDQRRVIYQPVTIEPRENTPRVVREEKYGNV